MKAPKGLSRRRRLKRCAIASLLLLVSSGQLAGQNAAQIKQANLGYFTEQNREAGWFFDQQSKVVNAVEALKPGRPGVIDAFVVVAGIDADPVFGREASQTARVLERRYGAKGRTITIAAGEGAGPNAVAHGSPANLWSVLAGVSKKMNLKEDVLILYTTSHGVRGVGIIYKDGQNGFGMISPRHLAGKLSELGFERRLVMISACFSGEFIPPLVSDQSIVITAASPIKTSFGCNPGNDWTFFGDALINNAMRDRIPLKAAKDIAFSKIAGWELSNGLPPSEPQYFAGSRSSEWLSKLESRIPRERTKPVGTPAIAILKEAKTATPAAATAPSATNR